MKRLSFVFCLLSLSVSSKGDEWYSPDAAWESEGAGVVTIWTGNPPKDKSFNVYSDGNMSEGDLEEWEELIGSYDKNAVMKTALSAAMKAAQVEAMVKNMSIKIDNSVVTITTGQGKANTNVKVQYLKSGSGSGSATSFHVPEYSVKKENDIFSLTKDGTETGDGWVQGTAPDNQTLENFKDGKIYRTSIKGWESADGIGSLSSALKSESATTESSYNVVVRKSKNGGLAYMPIGYGIGTPAWVTNALPKITNSWDMVTNAIPMITNSVEFVTNSVSVISNLVNDLEIYTNTTVKTIVTNVVENYTVITGATYKVDAFTNWNVMVNFTSNFSTRVIEQVDKLVNVTTNVITRETAVIDFVTNRLDMVNHFITNEYHVVTNVISETSNTIHVVTNVINTTVKVFKMPEIVWDPHDPSYIPENDPYNPESPYNPINDPDWKDNPENPFYDSSIGELERNMDNVTNLLTAATNDLANIAEGFNWTTNNWNDITNAINVLKSMKNETKIYNAISNGTYVSMYLDHESIGTNDSKLAEIKGFKNANAGTYPVKRIGIDNNMYIEWASESIPDASYGWTLSQSFESIQYSTETNSTDARKPFQIYGFSDANAGEVPVVNEFGRGGSPNPNAKNIKWIGFDHRSITNDNVFGISLVGFKDAEKGKIPFIDGENGETFINWTNITSAVASGFRITGSDGVTVYGTNIQFKAATDSNVTIKCAPKPNEAGTIEVEVGVYWK